ncbi:MAG: hypothetical protein HY706_10775 [Candidatus Hydrogenedentes bacterium]|nr:hypothetical protein [Candidatus Hydrogenedentota bacterium]
MTTKRSRTIAANPLGVLFGSQARVAVLSLFVLDPLRAYYQRQIESVTTLPIRAVQRELERLNVMGLLFKWVEGNRTYYQVNQQFPLFPDLRTLLLRTATDVDRLRAAITMTETVRLAFLSQSESRVLIVTAGEARPMVRVPAMFTMEFMNSQEFLQSLAERPEVLEAFLVRGVDLLGRREDLIWRRIEAAGYTVQKGKGVA